MAESNDIIDRIISDAAVRERLSNIIARSNPNVAPVEDLTLLEDSDLQQGDLTHLLTLAVNGNVTMKEQKVVVEYLRNDQRLLIPAALGMGVVVPGRCATNPELLDRYRRASSMTYADIRHLVVPLKTPTETRDAVALLQPAQLTGRFIAWDDDVWYTRQDIGLEDRIYADMIMGAFSQRLQFNCDIRDFGILCGAEMSVADDAWMTAHEVPLGRLQNKLRPYTLQCVAAANLTQVGGCALAAWVRAYGLGCGILPTESSRSIREYKFITSIPSRDDRQRVIDYDVSHERPLITLCANILAMFGLFHLNKDHTYRTNDPNMDRIARSYINTLRTDTTGQVIEYMLANMEAVVRTGPHPFGLAQTYWLARVMGHYDRLMAPLAVRINTCPPTVQRIMICEATSREWEGLPAGKVVSSVFNNELRRIRAYIDQIRRAPPMFSSLAALYGVPRTVAIPGLVSDAVHQVMPTVVGYILVTHQDDRNARDGLGHALSLQNVEREAKGLVMTWQGAWEKYISTLDQVGLLDFLSQVTVSPQDTTGDVTEEGAPAPM